MANGHESQTKQTFRVEFEDGTVVLIDAQSEKHARQAISRGRRVGRYTGRVVQVEPSKANHALAEDTFARIESSSEAIDAFYRIHG